MTPKKLLALVKRGNWFVQGFNGLPLYLHSVASMTGWMTKKDFGANYSRFFLRVHEHRAHWYYDETDMAKIGESYFRHIKSVKQLRKLESKHTRLFQKAKNETGQISAELLKQFSFKELCKTAERMVNELKMSVGLAHSHEGISFISEMRLKAVLDKRGLNTNENHQLLSAPIEPSFLSESQALLSKIKNSKGGLKNRLVKEYLNNFGWIDNSYVKGQILEEKDVYKKAKDLKHAGKVSNFKVIKEKKNRLIKFLRLTEEELFVVRTIEICTKWQDTRKKYIMQTIGRFEPIVEELAQRLGMTPEAFKYITPYEVSTRNLSSQAFVAKLKSRYPGCAYYTLPKNILVFPGKDYSSLEKDLSKVETEGVKEVKGSIANKGKVKGRARIIKTIHDIAKVKKGEILIAYMTRPEFMPAMQKAAAFVTNEGGITSHAAIVSREMHKPCVIGTKIATEIFKDGDLVEVDANKGVVRKL
jgi:phosphoenolpyruvate synthase/pyruvate phosphate dikinase